LLRYHPLGSWIAASEYADPDRQQALEQAGARVLRLPTDPNGEVNLVVLLERLGALGITCLMVEGGARIITSFLRHRLVDLLVLTVSPMLVGGLRAVDDLGESDPACLPRLQKPHVTWRGEDLILWGELARSKA
jgi:riboflavin biosynthesis pyrimidine reductase